MLLLLFLLLFASAFVDVKEIRGSERMKDFTISMVKNFGIVSDWKRLRTQKVPSLVATRCWASWMPHEGGGE